MKELHFKANLCFALGDMYPKLKQTLIFKDLQYALKYLFLAFCFVPYYTKYMK